MPRPQIFNPVDVHIGKQVQVWRVLIGISEAELAERLGLTYQQIRKYETGANRISAGRLWEISKVLGIQISYFFEGLNLDENAAIEVVDTNAMQELVDALETSPRRFKTTASLLLKSMAEGRKP